VREAKDATQKPYSFQVYYPGDAKKKQLFVYADSLEDMKDWMAAIKVCFLRYLVSLFSACCCSSQAMADEHAAK
jgi:hypothetical protein